MKSIDTNRDEAGPAGGADEARGHLPTKSRTPRSAKGRPSSASKAVPDSPDALLLHDGKGCFPIAAEACGTTPDPSAKSAGRSTHAQVAGSSLPVGDGGEEGRWPIDAKSHDRAPASPSVDQLAELQVRRKTYIAAVNKQTNAIKALVRRALGWRYDEEDGDREAVNKRASRIVTAALAGKDQKAEDEAVFAALAADLAVFAAAIEPMQKARHEVELEMKRLARKLPVFSWAKEVKGLGELGVAVIIAEAGDLAKYPKKGHLWKRLGLAPHEGKAYSTWRTKGGLSAEDWTAAGYSPRRRAEVYAVIEDPLLRAQTVVKGPYRAIYERRKASTEITHPDWTLMHRHRDAQRVMTKYLLRDLWQEWRRVMRCVPDGADAMLPAAEPNRREAEVVAPLAAAITILPTGDASAAGAPA